MPPSHFAMEYNKCTKDVTTGNQKEINALTMNSMPLLRGYNCAASQHAMPTSTDFVRNGEYRQQKFSCGRRKVRIAKEIKVQIFDSTKNICRNLAPNSVQS